MVKDDYDVIVYQILAYLYNCLKKDITIDSQYLQAQGELFKDNSFMKKAKELLKDPKPIISFV